MGYAKHLNSPLDSHEAALSVPKLLDARLHSKSTLRQSNARSETKLSHDYHEFGRSVANLLRAGLAHLKGTLMKSIVVYEIRLNYAVGSPEIALSVASRLKAVLHILKLT